MACLTQSRIWGIVLFLNLLNIAMFVGGWVYPWYFHPTLPAVNTESTPDPAAAAAVATSGGGSTSATAGNAAPAAVPALPSVVWVEESFRDRQYVNGMWQALAFLGIIGGIFCSFVCIVMLSCGDSLLAAFGMGGFGGWLAAGVKAKMTFTAALFETKAAGLCVAASQMLFDPQRIQDKVDPTRFYQDTSNFGMWLVFLALFFACFADLLLCYYPCAPNDSGGWFADMNSGLNSGDVENAYFVSPAQEIDEDEDVKNRLSSHGVDRAKALDPELAKKIEAEEGIHWGSVFGFGSTEPEETEEKIKRASKADASPAHFQPIFDDSSSSSSAAGPPPQKKQSNRKKRGAEGEQGRRQDSKSNGGGNYKQASSPQKKQRAEKNNGFHFYASANGSKASHVDAEFPAPSDIDDQIGHYQGHVVEDAASASTSTSDDVPFHGVRQSATPLRHSERLLAEATSSKGGATGTGSPTGVGSSSKATTTIGAALSPSEVLRDESPPPPAPPFAGIRKTADREDQGGKKNLSRAEGTMDIEDEVDEDPAPTSGGAASQLPANASAGSGGAATASASSTSAPSGGGASTSASGGPAASTSASGGATASSSPTRRQRPSRRSSSLLGDKLLATTESGGGKDANDHPQEQHGKGKDGHGPSAHHDDHEQDDLVHPPHHDKDHHKKGKKGKGKNKDAHHSNKGKDHDAHVDHERDLHHENGESPEHHKDAHHKKGKGKKKKGQHHEHEAEHPDAGDEGSWLTGITDLFSLGGEAEPEADREGEHPPTGGNPEAARSGDSDPPPRHHHPAPRGGAHDDEEAGWFNFGWGQ
ncbi:unnamed protein product [Amoebophrya sp. A25]|nr:unnamed protein product [Amoebophrya sp. A25]|eukprot:GSA25T00017725001.1